MSALYPSSLPLLLLLYLMSVCPSHSSDPPPPLSVDPHAPHPCFPGSLTSSLHASSLPSSLSPFLLSLTPFPNIPTSGYVCVRVVYSSVCLCARVCGCVGI
jgi:hypothetical protein